jgi:outer membrane protein TolC
VKDTENEVKSARIGLALQIQGTELQIRNTVGTLAADQKSAEASQVAVRTARESYNQTETAYRNGLSTYVDVSNAATQLAQARLGLLSQQYNYLNSLIDLEYYIGVPFGSLSNPEKAKPATDADKPTTEKK